MLKVLYETYEKCNCFHELNFLRNYRNKQFRINSNSISSMRSKYDFQLVILRKLNLDGKKKKN